MYVPKNVDAGLLIMRIGVAILFLWGGLGKFFGIFGGPGLQMFADMMLGGALWLAIVVATVELVAGIFVLIGFMTQEAMAALAVIIAAAIFMVHIPSGDIMGILIHVMLFTTLAGLALVGAGKYAVNAE